MTNIKLLVKKSQQENVENRKNMYDNIGKPTGEIIPSSNTHYLNMLSGLFEILNKNK